MTTYVGIDQSYTGFGLTLLDEVGYDSVLGQFSLNKYGRGVDRLVQIQRWLWAHLPSEEPVVCMEGYAPGATFGREAAGELGAAVKMALRDYGIYPTIVQPTALKKYILGAGKGSKNEILLGVYKKWNVEFGNDNLADSYGLARLAQAIEEPEYVKFKYEQEVIDNLKIRTEMPK